MDTRFSGGASPVLGASAVPTAIARERRYAARNYDPLPVAVSYTRLTLPTILRV